MKLAQLKATSHLSIPPNSYVYQIVPIGSHIAAISSDDSLRLINPITLQATPSGTFSNVHTGVTAARVPNKSSNVLLTSGRDASVKGWDVRTGSQTNSFQAGSNNNVPYLSLACNDAFVAAGTEMTGHQAAVAIWDYRNPSAPIRKYVESHNDDITELAFHPLESHILLSGSTDSLINIYNTHIIDEDDVLISITNHGSSVHHARFLSSGSYFGLSHDESFSLYKFEVEEQRDGDLDHVHFGDLRGVLNCDYIVDILETSDVETALICAGSHSHQYLDLVSLGPLMRDASGSNRENTIRLEGAHGGEIVRSVCFHDEFDMTVFTAGEDGRVRAWRMPSEAEVSTADIKKGITTSKDISDENNDSNAKSGGGKKSHSRFKPY